MHCSSRYKEPKEGLEDNPMLKNVESREKKEKKRSGDCRRHGQMVTSKCGLKICKRRWG